MVCIIASGYGNKITASELPVVVLVIIAYISSIMNPCLTAQTTKITSASDCIRCMFRSMVEIGVVTEHCHDDDDDDDVDASSLIHDVKPGRMFLRHAYYSNIIDHQSRYTSAMSRIRAGSHMNSHTLLLATTITTSATTNHVEHQHRSLLVQHLRGLYYENLSNNTNESVYMSNESEKGASSVGAIISILLCILIVVIFLGLGYCACWFSYGGYVKYIYIYDFYI